MEILDFGIVRPPKSGMLEFLGPQNLEFWKSGIVRPQDFGILNLSALKILEFRVSSPITLHDKHDPRVSWRGGEYIYIYIIIYNYI